MSSSTRLIRFLLDENVRIELGKDLRSQGFNCKFAAKGSSDRVLAELSKKEQRILVTNDADFSIVAAGNIFSVIWLRLPQNNPALLITSFERVLAECKNFQSRIVILEPSGWSNHPLPKEIKI